MSSRTRKGFTLTWTGLFVLSLLMQYMSFAVTPVLAVHDEGLFELDGNAVNQAVAGDDWDRVFAGTSAAEQTKFVTDAVNSTPAEHLFQTGGSKDGQDITNWQWTSGPGVQDKNDIEHAFAAAYTGGDSGTDTFIYFGQDRYAQDGDAFVGFWFLKSAISEKADGTFNGAHQDGDILVQVDFTNGGVIQEFKVSKWDNGGLAQIKTGVECPDASVPLVDDSVCGKVNGTGIGEIAAPWSFTPKSGTADKIPQGGFFEAGINLTTLGLDVGCFSTFLAETRSSQSLTSTLSDYAMGSFSFCTTPDISTQVKQDGKSTGDNGSVTIGDSVTDTATLTGSKGTVTGSVDFFHCFNATTTPDCSTGGTKLGATKALSGGSATSDAFTPDAIGHYCFRAEYTPAQGSKYLATSHTNTTSECFTVVKKVPSISTAATQSVDVGSSISDDATLSGATANAGGSITFRAYGPADPNCSDTPAFTSADFPVSGNGTYGTATFTPSTAGTYRWIASYSGDAKNAAKAGPCNDDGENDTVKKVTPSITTNASDEVTVGGDISDTATVSAGHSPTGTVTFALYGPTDPNCTGNPIFTSANRPLSGGSATSAAYTTLTIGTYRWIATYNGDANNVSVHGDCNDANESVVVNPATPSIATELHGSNGKIGANIAVPLGATVFDTSTLTDATATAGGTVHYRVFSDATCQTLFLDAGTATVTNGVPGGSMTEGFNIAGTYYWQADYSGDVNNEPASSACTLETVVVGKNIPEISTGSSETVVIDGAIHDTATLTDGFNPTGSITFKLFGPDNATCAGAALFSTSVDASGNGIYGPVSYTPTTAGIYRWIASYSGDANNAPAVGSCNDTGENDTITTPNLHVVKLVKTNDGGFGPTSTAVPGDKLTYQITITNSGDAAATNVPVSDDIAAILAHATYNNDCTDGCSKVGTVLNWTIPSIAAGSSKVLTFSVTLAGSFPAGTTHLPNLVVVTGPGSNCDQGSDDADCDTDTTVDAQPNLDVVKLVRTNDGDFGPTSQAMAGDVLTYQITIHNSGNAPATNVPVSDDISPVLAHATYNDDCSDSCSQIGSVLHWTIASIDAGGTKVLTFSASVDNEIPVGITHLPNVVIVTGPGSNCAAESQDTDCDTDTTIASSALEIAKAFTGNTDGTDPILLVPLAKIGDTLHYTLTYTGGGPLTKAVITDVLPVGLAYVDGTAAGDASFSFIGYDIGTRTLTWKAPTLPDPASGTVTYDVTVLDAAAEQPQPLTNTATIDSNETEPDTDTAQVAVLPPPLAATGTPRITLPPTDTFTPETGTSNTGFSLMLILLGLAGFAVTIGFITPVPQRVRRRDRQG